MAKVSREFASGGGDVPEFKWHIIEEKVPFEIGETGIQVLPFAGKFSTCSQLLTPDVNTYTVHHGRIFGTLPPPGSAPTPTTLPSTPTKAKMDVALPIETMDVTSKVPKIHPYICYGFKIQDRLVYISDVSHIPDDTWSLLERNQNGTHPVLVLDCLRLLKHTSHFGINEAVTNARRLGAKRTYCTGFGHEVSNEEYETIFKALGGEAKIPTELTKFEKRGISLIDEGKSLWMRPAFDGLRVWISEDGTVIDEGYE